MFFLKRGINEEVGKDEIPLGSGCAQLSVQGEVVHVAQGNGNFDHSTVCVRFCDNYIFIP
jgi:hypothetical protein